MATEIKEFDFKTCPFCGCERDVKRDYNFDLDLKYHGTLHVYKCHACGTDYQVIPVVTAYKAKMLEGGSHDQERFGKAETPN